MTKTMPVTERANAGLEKEHALERERSGTISMYFRPLEHFAEVNDPIWRDISSLAIVGRSIFSTCDETSTVERLVLDEDTLRAEDHVNFNLGRTFELPDGPDGEMDIEGLAVADGYLWICGSHSLKRDKIEGGGVYDLEDLDWDANRGFLGRVPLLDKGDGIFDLVGAYEPLDKTPARHARMVKFSKNKVPIRDMMAKDPLIGPYVPLPCKENGFDIEGIAVRGDTVLIGLRGPVIGGYAMIIRLEIKKTKGGFLKARKQEATGKRYALQSVDLNGQGIRDMVWQGERLLILTGATTDLECFQSVIEITDYDPERSLYPMVEVKRLLDLPPKRGVDSAEGLALATIKGDLKILIAYDSPSEERVSDQECSVVVDVFDLPAS
ncbi:hypothetical protein FP2506_12319 [Fulvimarina pelagi HTCC2506]|uniref:DUF3616 domain-containing protein n=2 Tax=Fulvimarina pelagi TaxID=217511 RepID=Q0G1N2_9HYPH|nr:DUF3616 domain-containing protein [Fulvimarina pelagi]EAU41049.1 hypothetical protein FP2506_12319 [Fulvimarina pelagi HTCC2506]BAT30935.1 hypothetical protein [Fulvimarina pelagi]